MNKLLRRWVGCTVHNSGILLDLHQLYRHQFGYLQKVALSGTFFKGFQVFIFKGILPRFVGGCNLCREFCGIVMPHN